MTEYEPHAAELTSLSDADWAARIERIGNEAGYYQRLGVDHAAFYFDNGPTLLVTFETRAAIRAHQPGQLPMGYDLARSRSWSHLCIIAETDSFYRDETVYRYFDRLVDDAFFEDFESVVFYGAGMCGYAAAAFSVTAPGATVVLVQPRATLDPRVAGWDPRFLEKRRLCFTDRYGFAPDMIEGAGPVFVLYDPELTLDSMHASLFARPFVKLIRCRFLGRDIGRALEEMRILSSLLAAATTGTFDERLFAIFYRGRRNYEPYLSRVLARLDADGRAELSAILCRSVSGRLALPKFRNRLAELETVMARTRQNG
ncbi:MAG: phosphoadenosine phosphosulfate reductase [Defluviimonas sp.]|uniref:phosphoadenosine phosphosulfate reductase n=1 Tax=Albidovulum sp. TaxID=1872424 RepID=UPI001D5B5DC2|nr:phosphoadenosine phosphosulfate reductase [Paracoccaceae bacterium]MCC0064775.1 phosphoadenosine phosphosulfate reductase [Defluviimonas sp.]